MAAKRILMPRNQSLRKMLRELQDVQRVAKRYYNKMQKRYSALHDSSLYSSSPWTLGQDASSAFKRTDDLRKILRGLNEARQEEKVINRQARERRLAEQHRDTQTYTVCAR